MALKAGRVGVRPDQVDAQGKIIGVSPDPGPGPSTVHTYSTNDQIVGKWIDGSDVYEIVVPIANTGLSEDLSGLKIKAIIEMTGPGTTSPILYDVACVSGTVNRAVYYSTTDHKIHCDGTQTVTCVIIKYLKEVE